MMLRNIKEFLTRLTPRFSFGVDPVNEMSMSLGIAPETHFFAQNGAGIGILYCSEKYQPTHRIPSFGLPNCQAL